MWLLRPSPHVLGKQSVITVQPPHMPNGLGLSASGCRPKMEGLTVSVATVSMGAYVGTTTAVNAAPCARITAISSEGVIS